MLAAVDPAQPYGAALPWPARGEGEARAAGADVPGAYVVLAGGEPILYLERGGRALQTLVAADDARLEPALAALVEHVHRGAIKRLALEKVDGEPAMGSRLAPMLARARVPGGTAAADAERLRAAECLRATRSRGRANRIRPVLEGRVPDEIRTPQPRHGRDRWPERLGRARRHAASTRTASTCSCASTAS